MLLSTLIQTPKAKRLDLIISFVYLCYCSTKEFISDLLTVKQSFYSSHTTVLTIAPLSMLPKKIAHAQEMHEKRDSV